ncbi:MAG: lipopolysaccharide kinase InaA family protein [Kiritimatiellia bacterium]|nr:lipopolysaccharide kinase InaA family protein [Kiritimatiellia bacterium]
MSEDATPTSAANRRIGAYRAELSPEAETPALAGALARMPEWLEAGEVLQKGRNRIVRCRIPEAAGIGDMVIKEFGRPSGFRTLLSINRPGKARRAWVTARALQAAGVGTPPPLALLEEVLPDDTLGASYLVTVFVPGLVSFREALNDLYRNRPLCGDLMTLLKAVAEAVRRFHASGWIHYDLGNQNILLPAGEPPRADRVLFVDLNRARAVAPTARRIARDLSRISLPSDLRRIFLEMIFDARPPRDFLRWEAFFRRAFAVHTLTRKGRHPIRERRIVSAPAYPPPREIWIWDEASAQAINVWSSRDRRALHLRTDGFRMLLAVARHAPAIRKAYRELAPLSYRQRVKLTDRIGVAVQMRPETAEREESLLAELGRIPLLIRAYHHETEREWKHCAEAVCRLAAAGHPMTLALVQDRRAVRDPSRWRAFVERMLDSCGAQLQTVELGHAVNRVKWGFWNLNEYRAWCEAVTDLPGRYPGLDWIGPAAIDFEYHRMLVFLKSRPRDLRFTALSHHLYVDRRGAPENRQGRFSTLGKTVLARAIARAMPGCGDRLILSEFNWPLENTGIHSPICSPYLFTGQTHPLNVTESQAAEFALRYLLLTICSGHVERAFFWRLVARGFGLVDDTDPGVWRPRPAFHALRDFLVRLGDAEFTGCPETPEGIRAWEFERDGKRHWILYAHPATKNYTPPINWKTAWLMPGGEIPKPSGELELTGTPLLLTEVEGRD